MNVRLKDDDGDEVPDLMLCVQGNEDGLHATRIRNRDKNASIHHQTDISLSQTFPLHVSSFYSLFTHGVVRCCIR